MNTESIIVPSLDSWTTIFALAAAHGFFLAFVLFFGKKQNRPANWFLGFYMFFFGLTLVEYVLHWSNYIYDWAFMLWWYKSIVFLFGPLLFLYFRAVEMPERLNWKDSLHFLPWLLFTINFLPYYLSSAHAKAALLRGIPEAREAVNFPLIPLYNWEPFLFVGHLFIYVGVIWWFLFKNNLFKQDNEDVLMQIKTNWYKTLLGLYAGFVLANLSYYVLVRLSFFKQEHDYIISFCMTLFIYTVGYLGYRQPQIFDGALLKKVFLAPKYQNSNLTPAASQSLIEKLLTYFETERPYLNNELRMASVARTLNTSNHHLSQVINQELGKSFSDFVNQYRLDEAAQQLSDPDNKEFIINIAYAAGFNNKTTFNKLFKARMGLSPSAYRKQQQGEFKAPVFQIKVLYSFC